MPWQLLSVLYLGVTLLPLALAWSGVRAPRPFWDELATGAGMLGFAIILVEFVLSGRFRVVSRRIGMDVTMRLHQLFARTALVLIVLHPFLYRTGRTLQPPSDLSGQSSVAFDLPQLATGILAWVLLPAFVLVAIGRTSLDWKYETWRLLHGLGAAVIAILALHHTLHAGRYSQDPALAGVWIVLFLLAMISLAFVYVLKPLSQMRRPWSVRSVRKLGLKTWELTLSPDRHDGIGYRAGQFVWLNVGHSPFSLKENPFSISSAPSSGKELQFVIKELGDFTRIVGTIAPGSRAHVDGPHGNLVLPATHSGGIVLVAGGVGIAPLIGILRQLEADSDTRPTVLVYGNRVAEQIAYRDELDELSRVHGTKVVHVLQEPPAGWRGATGHADGGAVLDALKGFDCRDWLFMLCGPPVMLASVETALLAHGVPARQILSERFSYD